VADADLSAHDQAPHEVAVAALDGEVNLRRGSVFAAEDFAEIETGAEFAPRLADQD
jgi:hypothetical protein